MELRDNKVYELNVEPMDYMKLAMILDIPVGKMPMEISSKAEGERKFSNLIENPVVDFQGKGFYDSWGFEDCFYNINMIFAVELLQEMALYDRGESTLRVLPYQMLMDLVEKYNIYACVDSEMQEVLENSENIFNII